MTSRKIHKQHETRLKINQVRSLLKEYEAKGIALTPKDIMNTLEVSKSRACKYLVEARDENKIELKKEEVGTLFEAGLEQMQGWLKKLEEDMKIVEAIDDDRDRINERRIQIKAIIDNYAKYTNIMQSLGMMPVEPDKKLIMNMDITQLVREAMVNVKGDMQEWRESVQFEDTKPIEIKRELDAEPAQ